ncbi:unnamed protein product [Amoebophrya sp. A25]|nr:unnamed protein product [Amoebophrya sp. A25]|eukprot:GSA25T00008642001.1
MDILQHLKDLHAEEIALELCADRFADLFAAGAWGEHLSHRYEDRLFSRIETLSQGQDMAAAAWYSKFRLGKPVLLMDRTFQETFAQLADDIPFDALKTQLFWQPLLWPYTVYKLHMQWEKDVRLRKAGIGCILQPGEDGEDAGGERIGERIGKGEGGPRSVEREEGSALQEDQDSRTSSTSASSSSCSGGSSFQERKSITDEKERRLEVQDRAFRSGSSSSRTTETTTTPPRTSTTPSTSTTSTGTPSPRNKNTDKNHLARGGVTKTWTELAKAAEIPACWQEFVASIPIPPHNFDTWHKVELMLKKLRYTSEEMEQSLEKIVIQNRDAYMARKLLNERREPSRTCVAVVGELHVDGLLRELRTLHCETRSRFDLTGGSKGTTPTPSIESVIRGPYMTSMESLRTPPSGSQSEATTTAPSMKSPTSPSITTPPSSRTSGSNAPRVRHGAEIHVATAPLGKMCATQRLSSQNFFVRKFFEGRLRGALRLVL